jgi:hypothetical protein
MGGLSHGFSGLFFDGFVVTNIILLPLTILLWKIYGELRQLNGKPPINLPGVQGGNPPSPPKP